MNLVDSDLVLAKASSVRRNLNSIEGLASAGPLLVIYPIDMALKNTFPLFCRL